jgi:hypothetical protein
MADLDKPNRPEVDPPRREEPWAGKGEGTANYLRDCM